MKRVTAFLMTANIVWMVLLPLILAYFFGKTLPGKKLNNFSPSLSTIIVFLIILGIVSPIKNVIFQNINLTIILFIIVSL
jgi:uncharacterized protein YqhQ